MLAVRYQRCVDLGLPVAAAENARRRILPDERHDLGGRGAADEGGRRRTEDRGHGDVGARRDVVAGASGLRGDPVRTEKDPVRAHRATERGGLLVAGVRAPVRASPAWASSGTPRAAHDDAPTTWGWLVVGQATASAASATSWNVAAPAATARSMS